MKKLLAVLFSFVLFCGVSSAQTVTGSKSTVQVADLTLVDWTTGDPEVWTTILGHPFPGHDNAVLMKMAEQKELLFSASLECGLYTRTLARSRGGNKDTSTASSSVQIRVLVDGATVAYPGSVTFCHRYQELSATLQGIIENLACFVDDDNDPETPPVFDPDADDCVLTPEEIELVLSTLNANAFFFILPDVGSGIHNIEVQAKISTAGSAEEGEWEAKALIGKGAIVVENHRLGKGDNILLEP
jgi:hypothetical protein